MRNFIVPQLLSVVGYVLTVGLVVAEEPATTPIIKNARELALNAPRPVYPISLKKQHKGDAGVFVLHVNSDSGLVSSVDVQKSTGEPLLDRSCIETFQKWRFKPHSIAPKVIIPIAFFEPAAKTK